MPAITPIASIFAEPDAALDASSTSVCSTRRIEFGPIGGQATMPSTTHGLPRR